MDTALQAALLSAANSVDPAGRPLSHEETERQRWWADPAAYASERLHYEPTPEQVAVMYSVRDNGYTAVVAANGTGKTDIASVLVPWWMECAPRSLPNGRAAERICYTTAPTARQVDNNLWKAIRSRAAATAPKLIGRMLPKESRWDIDEPGCFAQGIAATDEEGIKGQHAPYLLIIVDEAQGVKATIYSGIETMLKGQRARLLLIGNASQVAGQFFEAFHEQSALYSTIRIPARSHPNVLAGLAALDADWEMWKLAPFGTYTLPDDFDEPIPGAVSLWDLERLKIAYGVGTPAWNVVVEGEFPTNSDRTLVWLTWVDAAREGDTVANGPLPSRLAELTGKWAGLDVARFGNDRSCLVKMDGSVVESVETWQGHELHYTAGRAHEAVRDGYTVVYDEGGLGAGLTSHFTQDGLDIGAQVVPCNAGSAPDDTARDEVPTMRDQLWIDSASYLRSGWVDLSQLPADQFRSLKGELTAVEYDLDSKSRRKVESKDSLRKRIGRSPDIADALNLALHRRTGFGVPLAVPYDANQTIFGDVLHERF